MSIFLNLIVNVLGDLDRFLGVQQEEGSLLIVAISVMLLLNRCTQWL